MNDPTNIASPEKREEVYNACGFSIQQSTSLLEELLANKKALKRVPITKEEDILNPVVDFCIFLNYVMIEISSIVRAYVRAEILAEKQYHLKFVNWIILESYKYLYGYGKSVNTSLWEKNIEPLLSFIKDPQLIADFEAIKTQIIKFRDSNITNKDFRDISIHYDLDPLLIYEMLTGLNEEDETQRALAFLPLLFELFSFTNKYFHLFLRDNIVNKRFPQDVPLDLYTRTSTNNFSTDKVSELNELINQNKKNLDRLVRQQKWMQKLVVEEQEKDKASLETILLTLPILKVHSFIDILIIDLASAKRAFFLAEYPIEKNVFLKRINAIIYEGFKKLYGLNNNDNTYWNSYILQVENKIKSNASENLSNQLNLKLNMLRPTIKDLGKQRHLSIHLDEGVEEIYEMLVNLKPEAEFQKQEDFFKTIMQMLIQSIEILKFIEKQSEEKSKKSRFVTIQKAKNILELLANSPDFPGKEKTIKLIQQIISGEFYDNIMNNKSGK
ncbi:MAG: hypothetical protein RBR39_08710 [Proteiniphilum sp.]|jgi:hypothetical protein|nr:hypothetical protein [Proteiniphilum sp.]